MSWSKPLGDDELAIIRDSFPRKSCATIALELGRSTRSVQRAVVKLGLRKPAPEKAQPRTQETAPELDDGPPGGEQDELAELRELKRILKRNLREAIDPKAVPRLSAEFREVVKRIGELEGGGDGGNGNGAAGAGSAGSGSLLVSIPLRPS